MDPFYTTQLRITTAYLLTYTVTNPTHLPLGKSRHNNNSHLNTPHTYRVSQKKKVTIGPAKPPFLSETFEIFTVGRLFYSGFSFFLRFENF